jgi:SAM-dependent methyltransferase
MTADMAVDPNEQWRALLHAASERYRCAGRFARHFAWGKLGIDPVFRHLIEHGLIAPRARVLDVGCGQGLLASLLHACTHFDSQRRWPAGWAAAPSAARFTGIELMASDVQRAKSALGDAADFICGDMRHTPFPEADAVVILDVLHYVSVPEQDELLARARRALPVGGQLLLRVGDSASKRGFAVSRWVDAVVAFVRRRRVVPQFGRPLAEWVAKLESLHFEVRSNPMSEGTPFANVLIVARAVEAA